MPQSWTQAYSPQRRGTYFIPAALEVLICKISGHHVEYFLSVMLRSRLQYPVARTYVMHQEISVRMECDSPQCDWNDECASVDLRSSGSSGQGFHVTSRATDLYEQTVTSLCSGAVTELRIARRSFGGPNEAGEVINVR